MLSNIINMFFDGFLVLLALAFVVGLIVGSILLIAYTTIIGVIIGIVILVILLSILIGWCINNSW